MSDDTRKLCYNFTFIKDFLRKSRGSLDDTISTQMNNLIVRGKFDIQSLSKPWYLQRPLQSENDTDLDVEAFEALANKGGRTRYSAPSKVLCEQFAQALLESWNQRSKMIQQCTEIAKADLEASSNSSLKSSTEADTNQRLDPYSGRPVYSYNKAEELSRIMRTEAAVEDVIRDRTWRIVRESCGDLPEKWEDMS